MRGHRRLSTALVALAIAALAFVYRFSTLGGPLAGFDNDHYFQIVRAEAMLDGELSLRDYSDAELRSIPPQLTYATSAAAMSVMGRTLRSEAILGVGMLALGAAALVWAAAEMSQSVVIAAIVTLLAVGLSPTLYNYPKITPYAVAVIAFLAYARTPTTSRLVALAIIEVVAMLYRHDHGVYVGIATVTLLLAEHGWEVWKPLLRYAAFVLVGLAPGLLFVHQHGGILKYVRECLDTSRHEVGRTAAPPSSLTIDLSQPLLLKVPPPRPPMPRIAIRWTGDVSADDRTRAERELGLADPQPRGDERNWGYAIADASSRQLAAIVNDRRVADTDGIDRRRFTLSSKPPPPPARAGVLGWRLAPGVLRESNADPWLRLMAFSVLSASVALLAWPSLRRRVHHPHAPFAAIAATCVMGALVCVVFLRNPGPFRLADASVPISVLGSWVLTATQRLARDHGLPLRVGTSLALAAALILSTLAVGVVGSVKEQVTATGIGEGWSGISGQSRQLWRMLGGLPSSLVGIDETLAHAAAYLKRCTRPSDRLLVADNLPELYYFARRRFAAGQMVFFGGFYTTEDQQREVIARWSRQSVPIVLTQTGEHFVDEFSSDYPLLASYLNTRYRRVGAFDAERSNRVDVWVVKNQMFYSDNATGLPCVANSQPSSKATRVVGPEQSSIVF